MTTLLSQQDYEINTTNIATINDGCCVGDMIIHFWLRQLEKKFSSDEKKSYFFMPCITQFVQTYPLEMVRESIGNIKVLEYSYVFMPLADFNVATLSASHWSCLYMDNTQGTPVFYHFDSMHQKNYEVARQFATKFSMVYNIKGSEVIPLNCKNQTNGYDCGVYVMAYIDNFLETKNHEEANKKLERDYVYQYRKMVRDKIYEMVKEQNQSS